MSEPATYDDPDFRAAERAIGRRRLLAASIALVALIGVAGGSVAGAVASAQTDRASASSHAVVDPD